MNQQNTVWITGASSGIGLALVKCYLKADWRVIASARSQGELSELMAKDSRLTFVPFDIVDKSQISRVRDEIAAQVDCLDCAILNAGTCEYLDIEGEQTDWPMMERVMSVNFFGMVNSVEMCLPLLQKIVTPPLSWRQLSGSSGGFSQSRSLWR